jgi:hypothetical protein
MIDRSSCVARKMTTGFEHDKSQNRAAQCHPVGKRDDKFCAADKMRA